MKKGTAVFLTIVAVLMLIGAVECGIIAIIHNGESSKIEDGAKIDISDIDEYTVLYFEELEVVGRYAFQTADEYSDSDSGYTDTTYYVYEGDQPMDSHELHAEYYIVKFSDSSNEYITSLCVAADQDVDSLKNTPVRISACVSAAPASNSSLQNENDKKLQELREDALDAYAEDSGIERVHVTFSYQAESAEQHQSDMEKDVVIVRVILAVASVGLVVGGVCLIRFVRKKK